MKARLLPLCLLTAALGALPALAQTDTQPDAPKPDRSSQMEKRRQEILARFDKNGDGKLDDEEKAEMRAAQKKEKEAGPRGSGDISSMGGGQPGGPGSGDLFAREMIKRFDKDGDGKLDSAELTEALKARGQFANNGGGPGGAGGQLRGQMMKMFDKNGDGVIDESERAEMMKFRDEQVARFDKDGDGKLNEEERAEAMKAFMADHPEMVPPAQQ